MAQVVSLDIDQGSDLVLTWICTDVNGSALDFTGAEITLTARPSPTSTITALFLNQNDGTIEINGPTAGTFQTWFPSSETYGIDPQSYYYNLVAYMPSGLVFRLAEGYLAVNPQVIPGVL